MGKYVLSAMAVLGVMFLASCANTVDLTSCVVENDISGFWFGLWNGLTVTFAWIGSLFSDDIAIYDVNNNGGWYDFGFWLGVVTTLGGSSRS